MMTATQAAAQVNATKFKPGWRPVARVAGVNRVEIGFEVETVDTSYRTSDGRFTRPITMPSPTRTLDAGSLTEQSLDYELLKLAASLDEHENREFLQRRQPDGKWVASLHPHTTDGELGWLQCQLEDAGLADKDAVARVVRALL